MVLLGLNTVYFFVRVFLYDDVDVIVAFDVNMFSDETNSFLFITIFGKIPEEQRSNWNDSANEVTLKINTLSVFIIIIIIISEQVF